MTSIPADIIAAARASQAKWGIPASISVAQWAVESEWGRRMPAGSNNPFGIKAVAGQPSVTARTREEDRAGHSYYINAPFRKFASFVEAFDLHAKLLATGVPYVRARTKLPDANAFADALTGVYATAHNYGSTLKSIMRSNNLFQYDAPGAAAPAPEPRDLNFGDRGDDVAALQRTLGIHDDGIFGAGTRAVVMAFQRIKGLAQDGIVGRATRAALA